MRNATVGVGCVASFGVLKAAVDVKSKAKAGDVVSSKGADVVADAFRVTVPATYGGGKAADACSSRAMCSSSSRTKAPGNDVVRSTA